jgi:uncharacterized protein YdaU (DUF1376 family)
MPKLPFMQFYPGDWLIDTRRLSLEAKGAWIELIVVLWNSETRGVLKTKLSELRSLFGITTSRIRILLEELKSQKICDIEEAEDGELVIRSRRISREEKARQQTAERVRNHRERNANVTHDVTPARNGHVTATHTRARSRSDFIYQNSEESSGSARAPAHEAGEGIDPPKAAAASFSEKKSEETAAAAEDPAANLPFFLVRLAGDFPELDVVEEFRCARDKLAGEQPGEAYMRKWLAFAREKLPKPKPKFIPDFEPRGWYKFLRRTYPQSEFSKRWEMLPRKTQIEVQQHFIEQHSPPAAPTIVSAH